MGKGGASMNRRNRWKTAGAALGTALFLATGILLWRRNNQPEPLWPEQAPIETAAIYDAVDQEFFSHGQAAVTSRQLYQRRAEGGPPQYVVEYAYRAPGGNLQRSRYLVVQQSDGGYAAKWFPPQ